MTAESKPFAAMLICTSGSLAGTRHELGPESTIGIDADGHVVVARGRETVAHPLVRIFVVPSGVQLEAVGEGVTLDGVPASGRVSLDRRHIIALRGAAEFVYSRTLTDSSRRPAVPAPPPVTPSPVVPPPARDAQHTVVEPDGFSALPQLQRDAPGAPPNPAPKPSAVRGPAAAEHTVMSAGGFDALPKLATDAESPPGPDASEAATVIMPNSSARDPKPQSRVAPPAPKSPAWTLDMELTGSSSERRSYPLKLGDNIIGRGDHCDIQVPDPRQLISRQHAIVRVSDDRVELIDLKGPNGTFMNGRRVTTATLAPGSTFDLAPDLAFTLRKR